MPFIRDVLSPWFNPFYRNLLMPSLPLPNTQKISYVSYTTKLSRLCTKHTIHWKTFAVHQAHAIMYCIQQMIQGGNFVIG